MENSNNYVNVLMPVHATKKKKKKNDFKSITLYCQKKVWLMVWFHRTHLDGLELGWVRNDFLPKLFFVSLVVFFFLFCSDSYFAALWSLSIDLPKAKDSCRLLFWPQDRRQKTGFCLLILLHLRLAEIKMTATHICWLKISSLNLHASAGFGPLCRMRQFAAVIPENPINYS